MNSRPNNQELQTLLLHLTAVTKALSLALDPAIVPQISESEEKEAQRVLATMLAALVSDVVQTTWLCAKEGASRQLQVLERQAFELATRSCFYVDNADVAQEHWRSTNTQFIRVARKLHGEASPDFLEFRDRVLQNDAGFSVGTSAQTAAKPRFDEICKAVYGENDRYYAGHYSLPSPIAHGAPAAFAYVFEPVGNGYRLRTSPGMLNEGFTIRAICQCGINAAASVAALFRAPTLCEAIVLCEKLHRSFGYETHLLVRRELFA